MSNNRGFKPNAPDPVPATYDALACAAWGCPLKGTMDIGGGGKFFCHCHAHAPSKEWQNITGLVRSHEWLIEFTNTMRAAKRTSDWRGTAARFWAQAEPELMAPHKDENLDGYVYRLHLELEYRVGARATRPTPVIPGGHGKQFKRMFGSIGEMLPERREAVAA